jgi:hypothetical protein
MAGGDLSEPTMVSELWILNVKLSCHYVQRENIRKNSIYANQKGNRWETRIKTGIKYQDLKKTTMHNFEKLKGKSDGYCSSGLRSFYFVT